MDAAAIKNPATRNPIHATGLIITNYYSQIAIHHYYYSNEKSNQTRNRGCLLEALASHLDSGAEIHFTYCPDFFLLEASSFLVFIDCSFRIVAYSAFVLPLQNKSMDYKLWWMETRKRTRKKELIASQKPITTNESDAKA